MPKKVLITLPVLLTGGTEFQTLSLVKVLSGAGYAVTVCCFYEYEESMVVAMENADASVKLLKLDQNDGLLSLLKKLVIHFRNENPDICHIQYMAPGFIPVVAARLARVPIVFATVHQPGHPYGAKAHLLLRIAASICTKFICISKSVEKSWFGSSAIFDAHVKKNGPRHCTIFNAVDLKAIVAASESSGMSEIRNRYVIGSGLIIGCVARLRAEKGQKILIEAFAEVVKTIPDAQLLMIGDGPDKVELFRLSEKLGVNSRIVWLGRQEQAEVYKLYGTMEVVVVPSLFEGFGLTAAEAMAAGVPVIASDIDGLAEVVHDGETGILFSVGNSRALADSLIRMLNNPSLIKLYGENAQERVRKYFMLEQFSDSMLALYGHYNGKTDRVDL